jgi:MHS family shikimate/dehydroshikimate transporter-like MFS transporter
MPTNIARRTAVASLIGTCIEWYDFYIYGTASAIVFGALFFPTYDATVGTMLAFATFALGAIMRPLGGLVCGHYGDRVGRKSMLVLTLITMGIVTFAIGLLPTYSQVGVLAPILLIALRMIQGFAFGGEWGGAVLMAVEHAPKERRGFYGCFPQMGSPIALFLSTGTFALLALLPKEAFLEWGWRVPFLLSAILVVVGLMLRLQLFESPEFAAVVSSDQVADYPVLEVFRDNLGTIAIATGAVLSTVVAFYVQTLFVVSYAVQTVGMARQTVLNAVLIGAALELVMLPLFAMLSDRIGRRPVALFGAALTAGGAFPFFALVQSGTFASVTAAICLAMVGISALYAVIPAYISELFSARVRYSGISASYTIASGLIGGFSPAIGTGLYAWAQGTWPVALYLVAVGLISLVCIWLGRGPAASAATLPQTMPAPVSSYP